MFAIFDNTMSLNTYIIIKNIMYSTFLENLCVFHCKLQRTLCFSTDRKIECNK